MEMPRNHCNFSNVIRSVFYFPFVFLWDITRALTDKKKSKLLLCNTKNSDILYLLRKFIFSARDLRKFLASHLQFVISTLFSKEKQVLFFLMIGGSNGGEGALVTRAPLGPISFIFMRFSARILPIYIKDFYPKLRGWCPRLGNPGSATACLKLSVADLKAHQIIINVSNCPDGQVYLSLIILGHFFDKIQGWCPHSLTLTMQ